MVGPPNCPALPCKGGKTKPPSHRPGKHSRGNEWLPSSPGRHAATRRPWGVHLGTAVSPPGGHWLVLRLPARARDKSRLTRTTCPQAVRSSGTRRDPPAAPALFSDVPKSTNGLGPIPMWSGVSAEWEVSNDASAVLACLLSGYSWCAVDQRRCGMEHGAPRYQIPSGNFARCAAGELQELLSLGVW